MKNSSFICHSSSNGRLPCPLEMRKEKEALQLRAAEGQPSEVGELVPGPWALSHV